VVGKSFENVYPAIYVWPEESTAIPPANSWLLPPASVEYESTGSISNGSVRASVINNTIVNNRDRGVAIGGANAQNVAPTGATLRNNLIQNNNNVSISIEQGPPSAVVGYSGNFNLVFYSGLADQTKTYRPTTIVGDNDVNLDAEFVDADGGDLHLLPTSPAIDAGTGNIGDALLAPLFDRATTADGVPDDPPIDIGYHYPAQ